MGLNTAHAQTARADSIATALGTMMGSMISPTVQQVQQMSGVQIDINRFCAALSDYLQGKPTGMTPQEANDLLQEATTPQALPAPSAADEAAFLQRMAAKEGNITTPSGLVFEVITEGEGTMPGSTDKVMVDYVGRFSDGLVFDNTEGEGPIQLGVDHVVRGMAEGLQMMRPGGTYRLYMPAELGYGSEGIPGAIPPGAALDFTVTLHDIVKP